MANKCIHTYTRIRSCPFSQNISVRYSISALKNFQKKTDFGSSYKKSFEYAVNCVRGYTKCGLIYTFVRAGFR